MREAPSTRKIDGRVIILFDEAFIQPGAIQAPLLLRARPFPACAHNSAHTITTSGAGAIRSEEILMPFTSAQHEPTCVLTFSELPADLAIYFITSLAIFSLSTPCR